MSYLVFARKFRPQTFDEIVGQEPVVRTFKNAIRQGRVSQNFLFSGPRGIGKTSTARILAKALNCQKGPTETPCGKCTSCLEITNAGSLDVLEIDGASNRGIDEIRNLRETVKFKPVSGRVKIYIIDEVHMLTTEAFNALLKTLEEPPPHVKFVFATTEPHKVPLTILSRCQRFNFKRIPTSAVVGKLEEIVKSEKLKADPKALYAVAKASEGSLRDAEGLLDQLASFAEKKIREEDVLAMLGLASEDVYFSLLAALKERDARKVFTLIGGLYDEGADLVQFAKGLLEFFRNLLLFQCAEGAEHFVEMSKESAEELKKQKDAFGRGELLLALSLTGNLQNQLRRNLAPPRLLVETALLKLLHLDGLKPIDEVNASSFARPAELHPPVSVPPAPMRAKPAASGPGTPSMDEILSFWPRVVEFVKTKRMSTGIFLSESEPVELEGKVIVLGLPREFQFHRDMLEKEANRALIEEAVRTISSSAYRVKFVITESAETGAAPAGPSAAVEENTAQTSEIITEALSVFEGGKIVRKE